MCFDIFFIINKIKSTNCFQTPKNTNKRRSKNCTSTTDPANDTQEEDKWTQNVKRKLVFEENEENAFIKLNDVCNSIQIGYNGRYSKT